MQGGTDQTYLITALIKAAFQHGGIGFVFMDLKQTALEHPCSGIEPLDGAEQLGQNEVNRMVKPYVRLLVGNDKVTIALIILS